MLHWGLKCWTSYEPILSKIGGTFFWKFTPNFQTWNRIFFWFCKKSCEYSKIAKIYLSWISSEPIFSKIREPFLIRREGGREVHSETHYSLFVNSLKDLEFSKTSVTSTFLSMAQVLYIFDENAGVHFFLTSALFRVTCNNSPFFFHVQKDNCHIHFFVQKMSRVFLRCVHFFQKCLQAHFLFSRALFHFFTGNKNRFTRKKLRISRGTIFCKGTFEPTPPRCFLLS